MPCIAPTALRRNEPGGEQCNVLVLAEWLTPGPHGVEIADTWLNAEFGEGFAPSGRIF